MLCGALRYAKHAIVHAEYAKAPSGDSTGQTRASSEVNMRGYWRIAQSPKKLSPSFSQGNRFQNFTASL